MDTATIEQRPLSYEEERGKPLPNKNHGSVQMKLGAEFLKSAQYRVYSELTLDIDGTPFTPDLAVYPQERIDLHHDQTRRKEPPLLAVEIFSPSQGAEEVMEKVDAYFRFGVKSCWIVSPPLHTVQIIAPDGRTETFHTGVIADPVTGLRADLDQVFA